MNTAQKTADPFEHRGVVQLGCAASAPGVDREAEPRMLEQRAAVVRERRHHRNLLRRELEREGMLLVDLRIAPARRAVESYNFV